ncbi:hypothetical protein N9D31_01175 [Oligoflexaceae bacterium]|nr:hypothetical protein [Oligoflexaceae bacterium]
MKKQAVPLKYPNSANLFQFCRKVLDNKFGGIRVIDQDVGQILGFDPADCSHWKKGKKNIKSIAAMKSIAEHLGVDERLVIDVASGELNDGEAFEELNGYGLSIIDKKVYEQAKQEFYKKNASTWTREKEAELRDMFSANEPAIDAVVERIHSTIHFSEAPLYLPEIAAVYKNVKLTAAAGEDFENAAIPITHITLSEGSEILYQAGTESKPFMRYQLAKSFAKEFLRGPEFTPTLENEEHIAHIKEVQSNLFSAKLLTPAKMVRKEIASLNVSKDIVQQLAEIFWVSKSFMNRRLKEILEHDPKI